MVLSLPFRIVPARHRLDVISDDMKLRVLKARRAFADGLPEALADSVEFFDAGRYNAAATLQDNILFGKLAYGDTPVFEYTLFAVYIAYRRLGGRYTLKARHYF